MKTGDELQDTRGSTLLWLLGSLGLINFLTSLVIIPFASNALIWTGMLAFAQVLYVGMFLLARRGYVNAAAFLTALVISSLILGAAPVFGIQSIYFGTLVAPMILVGFCARSLYCWLLLIVQCVWMAMIFVFLPADQIIESMYTEVIMTICVLSIVPVATMLNTRFQRRLIDRLLDMNDTLEHARARAEESSKAKSLFLATMSHELRTPLSTIMGYTDLACEGLEDDEIDREQVTTDLGLVKHAGDHLLGLIDDVLDLSRVESGQIRLDLEPILIPDLLEQLAREVSHAVNHNANTLVLACDEQLESITSDRKRVRQVLLNLLSNAAKFTHQGTITLRASLTHRDGDARAVARFDVIDTGIGLAQKDQARIFERFEQADASTTRKYGGTGLGLSLSRELAHALQGLITVESEPGEGACFSFIVPVTPSVEAA